MGSSLQCTLACLSGTPFNVPPLLVLSFLWLLLVWLVVGAAADAGDILPLHIVARVLDAGAVLTLA